MFVSGEAGIGKSRSAVEFSKQCENLGIRVLHAKCVEEKKLIPYSAWIELIDRVSEQLSATQFFKITGNYTNQIIRLLPNLELGRKKRRGDNQSPTLPERGRRPFYNSVTQFFLRLCKEKPTVIFIDDLQWADSASLEFLQFFHMRNRGHPILVVTLYQESDRLRNLVDQLSESCVSIPLGRLQRSDVDEFVSTEFANPSKRLQQLIFSKTGGNPLFIQELISSLKEENIVVINQSGQSELKSGLRIRVPKNIREVIAARLNRLDHETIEILSIASVLGMESDMTALEKISGFPKEKLLETIRSAPNFAVLEDNGVIRFTEELVRDELYGKLESEKRIEYHESAAAFLEQRYQDSKTSSIANQLAFHFIESGNPEKAVKYCVLAGREAALIYAHEEARTYLSLALHELKKFDQASEDQNLLKGEILDQMGDQMELQGAIDESLQYRLQATEMLRNLAQGKIRAGDNYRKIGLVYNMLKLDLKSAMEYYGKAVEILEAEGPNPYLGYAYGDVALTHLWAGDTCAAIEAFDKALSVAKSLGVTGLQTLTMAEYAATLPANEWEKAKDLLTKSVQSARDLDFEEVAYSKYYAALLHAIMEGASAKSLRMFLDGIAFCEKVDMLWPLFIHKIELALEVYLPLGEIRKARQIAVELYTISQNLAGRSAILDLASKMALGRVLFVANDIESSEKMLAEVASKVTDFGSLQLLATARLDLASLYLEKKDYEQAAKYLNETYRILKKRGLTIESARYYVVMLSTMLELEARRKATDNERVENLMMELRETVKKINADWAYAYESYAEGLVHNIHGKLDFSERSFEASLTIWKKLGWRLEAAKTLLELANLQQLQKNFKESESSLEQALEISKQAGAERYERIIEQRLQRVREYARISRSWDSLLSDLSTRAAFERLLEHFFEDRYVKQMALDNCGWKTLNDLAKICKLPRSSFYTSGSRGGEVFKELVKSGLVETRVYAGERGRGGNVLKMRAAYDKSREIQDYMNLLSEELRQTNK